MHRATEIATTIHDDPAVANTNSKSAHSARRIVSPLRRLAGVLEASQEPAITMLPEMTRRRTQLLYAHYIKAIGGFSYNFREYFIRRTRYRFRTELPAIVARNDYEALDRWWEDAHKDLAQLKRAVAINRMYQAPQLVVEGKGKMMAPAGGGDGAEASP